MTEILAAAQALLNQISHKNRWGLNYLVDHKEYTDPLNNVWMIYALMLVLLLHFTKKLELFISNFKQCSEFSWDVLLQNAMWVEFAHSVSKNKYVQISKSTLSLKSQVLILDTYHVIKCFSSIDFWLLLMWHLNVVTLRCLIVYIGSTVI